MSVSLGHVALAFGTGVGIPIMAALNGHLGGQIGTGKATVVLFALALAISLVFLTVSLSGQPATSIKEWQSFFPNHVSYYFYLGGCFVAFYVLSITYVAPIMGVANAIVLVLLGQIISAVLIDHFALFNSVQVSITWERILGVVLMVLGIYLARK